MFKRIICFSTLVAVIIASSLALKAAFTEKPIYQKEKIGVMVIDVQKYYIPWARDVDIDQTIENIGTLMKLNSQYKLPYYMTFEFSTWRPIDEHDDHMKIDDRLVPHVPTINSKKYLKVTFDATKQPELLKDLRASGLTKMVVSGAETDVCVIQTVLGLKRLGIDVYLVKDAVYTSEANERPAFIRMVQAGVKFISTKHFERVLKNNEPLTADIDPEFTPKHTTEFTIVDPNQSAFLLNSFQMPAIDAAVNKSIKPMLDRYNIMFYRADAHRTPVYFVKDQSYNQGFPKQFYKPKKMKTFSKKGLSATKAVKNLTKLIDDRDITQIYVAGVYSAEELRRTVNDLLKINNIKVFIVQDLIFSKDKHILSQIESLYHKGAIAMTYKMFFYGENKSVNWFDFYSRKYNINYWQHTQNVSIPYIDSLDPVVP